MSVRLVFVGLAIGAAGLGAAYLQGREHGRSDCEAAQAREERVARLATDAAVAAAAEAISKIKVQHATVQHTLEREVIEKPVFRDCRSGPVSVRAFNAGIPGAPAAPAADSELPAKDAPAR